jgi:hypothetical protein
MTYKFDDLGHFHLIENATSDIVAQTSGIADSECVRTFHGHFAGLTAIEFLHSLHFSESHKVAILKAMARLIQTSNKSFFVL